MTDTLPRKYRAPAIYFGAEHNEDIRALQAILRARGETLGQLLLPALEELREKYRKEIAAFKLNS